MRIAILLSMVLLFGLAATYSLRLPGVQPPPPTIAPGVMLDQLPVGRLATPTAGALLSWLAPLWDHPPVDASIDHATGTVRPGQPGWRLDAAKTMAAILAAGPDQKVAPVLETVAPRWPAESLRNLSTPLASFQTTITGEANRVHNMELAASLLNNTLVLPGQVFSFNAVAGPYDAARGYLSAPVIVDNRYESGLAGGVCQLSSTLYQTVLNLGLAVVERHPHTLPVPYIQPGHDATVAGSLDFRFRNTLATPLVIKASRQGDSLVVTILGRRTGAGSVSPAAS
ncbi:MAG: VanW family protein [Peptococcaceae bacterium]|nr:VanW family protein [Peptococcaceae bacterium]